MLRFTFLLQYHITHNLPYFTLIFTHVTESLVFVPIMMGIYFFLFEFFSDQLLAFLVLLVVWVGEVYSILSLRSKTSIRYFPKIFLSYFFLFHIYFFSYPFGFSYLALFTTTVFVFHSMMHFWNLYEVPAYDSGTLTAVFPRIGRPMNLPLGSHALNAYGIPSLHDTRRQAQQSSQSQTQILVNSSHQSNVNSSPDRPMRGSIFTIQIPAIDTRRSLILGGSIPTSQSVTGNSNSLTNSFSTEQDSVSRRRSNSLPLYDAVSINSPDQELYVGNLNDKLIQVDPQRSVDRKPSVRRQRAESLSEPGNSGAVKGEGVFIGGKKFNKNIIYNETIELRKMRLEQEKLRYNPNQAHGLTRGRPRSNTGSNLEDEITITTSIPTAPTISIQTANEMHLDSRLGKTAQHSLLGPPDLFVPGSLSRVSEDLSNDNEDVGFFLDSPLTACQTNDQKKITSKINPTSLTDQTNAQLSESKQSPKPANSQKQNKLSRSESYEYGFSRNYSFNVFGGNLQDD